jgi:membrane protein required for colicin V production
MNWLDVVLLVILGLTVVVGFLKGFLKQIIGIAAVIAGLILAAVYYWGIAEVLKTFIRNELVANFLGFVIIFVCVLILGSLAGYLLTKAMKGPLAFVNRLFGGVLGLVKGVLICGVFVFALLVFRVAEGALLESRLAPACYGITRAAVHLIPKELRDRFQSSYQEIRRGGGGHGKKI